MAFTLRPVTTTYHFRCAANNCEKTPVAFWGEREQDERFGYTYCENCLLTAGTRFIPEFVREAKRFLKEDFKAPNLQMTAPEIKVLLSGV